MNLKSVSCFFVSCALLGIFAAQASASCISDYEHKVKLLTLHRRQSMGESLAGVGGFTAIAAVLLDAFRSDKADAPTENVAQYDLMLSLLREVQTSSFTEEGCPTLKYLYDQLKHEGKAYYSFEELGTKVFEDDKLKVNCSQGALKKFSEVVESYRTVPAVQQSE